LGEGLNAPGVEHRRPVGVVAVPVPRPARQVQRVPRPPLDPLPIDLGPPTARFDELDRVPGMTVNRRRGARRELVERGVQVLCGPIAVPARVDAAPRPAARGVVHDDVAPLDDRLAVALPLVEKGLAPFLLDLVVRDLCRGRRLHVPLPYRAPADATPDTRGSTSRASVSICSIQSGNRMRKSKMSRSQPSSW